jgi:hypothetical protein
MPTVAMVMAISPSVTVSIGDETMGVRSVMFLVTLVVRSTWDGSTCSVHKAG